MKDIRDEFIYKIKSSIKSAIGAHIALQQGIQAHQSSNQSDPNARLILGLPPSRIVKYAPTNSFIQDELLKNRTIILELYLTEIIQHWFDFLCDIYDVALQKNLSGSSSYEFPVENIQVDLSLPITDYPEKIRSAALRNFDFLPACKKIKSIRKILKINNDALISSYQVVRLNIEIRNILQHKLGVVDEKILKDLGVSSIPEDHGDYIKQIGAGQKVTRTVFDLEKLVDAMVEIAKVLIPDG